MVTQRSGRAASGVVLALVLTAVSLVTASGASAYEFGPTVRQIGPEETVFDWGTQRCDDLHIPDNPVRAFRDSSNQVQLISTHYVNRRMIGPDLNSIGVDCTVTMSSHENADPAAYDDKEWIAATYTADGKRVYAIVHDEYQGWNHPGMCSSQGTPSRPKRGITPAPSSLAGFDPTCWYNALTLATSSDAGLSYTHTTPPSHLAASVPYVYVPNTGPYGYFSPSNIIQKPDRYFYMLIQAEPYEAQEGGACLIRSRNPASPTSWRAWDGAGFNVKFINPYLPTVIPVPPEQHVCEPVDFLDIEKMVQSITYSSYFRKFLLIGHTGLFDPGSGENVYGAYYSTSTDLIHWSPRQLLMKAELPWSYECGDDNPILYPVVLDPASTKRNFETSSRRPYLYFTRFNYENCVQTLDRDLIRIPIEFIG